MHTTRIFCSKYTRTYEYTGIRVCIYSQCAVQYLYPLEFIGMELCISVKLLMAQG